MTGVSSPRRAQRPAQALEAAPAALGRTPAPPGGPAGPDSRGPAALLRGGLLGLAGLAAAGAAVELAMLRHWHGPMQLLPWAALVAVAAGEALLAVRPSRGVVRGVRVLAVAVGLCTAAGVYAHIAANYEAGPLDQRYTATWATLPAAARWWAAASLEVGPAPPVAPGVLAQAALALLLATARHPALARRAP